MVSQWFCGQSWARPVDHVVLGSSYRRKETYTAIEAGTSGGWRLRHHRDPPPAAFWRQMVVRIQTGAAGVRRPAAQAAHHAGGPRRQGPRERRLEAILAGSAPCPGAAGTGVYEKMSSAVMVITSSGGLVTRSRAQIAIWRSCGSPGSAVIANSRCDPAAHAAPRTQLPGPQRPGEQGGTSRDSPARPPRRRASLISPCSEFPKADPLAGRLDHAVTERFRRLPA